jgi:hypothetical protein
MIPDGHAGDDGMAVRLFVFTSERLFNPCIEDINKGFDKEILLLLINLSRSFFQTRL